MAKKRFGWFCSLERPSISSCPSSGKQTVKWIVIIAFVLAIVGGGCYRLSLWAWLVEADPPSLLAGSDEGNYFRVAKKINDGKTATDDVANAVSFRSVVFPLLAAPMLGVAHFDPWVLRQVRLLVALGGILCCLVGLMLVYRLVDRRARLAAAGVALLLLLFDSQLGVWSALFLTDGPAVGLLLVSIYRLIGHLRQPQGGRITGVWSGLLFGLTALVKFDYLYVLWLLIGYGFTADWRERRRVSRQIALAAAVYALMLGGYGVRNLAHTGTFFITSKDTVNLWIGNNPGATGRYYSEFPKPDLSEILSPTERLDITLALFMPNQLKQSGSRTSSPEQSAEKTASTLLRSLDNQEKLPAIEAWLSPAERDEFESYFSAASQRHRQVALETLNEVTPEEAASFFRELLLKPEPNLSAVGTEVKVELRLREWARARVLRYFWTEPLDFARGLAHKFWLIVSLCNEPQFAFLGGASLPVTVALELGVAFALWGALGSRWRRQFRVELGFLLIAYFAEMFVLVAVFVDPRLMLLNLALATLITSCAVGETLAAKLTGPAHPKGAG